MAGSEVTVRSESTDGLDGETTTGSPPSTAVMFDLLSEAQRRRTVRYLAVNCVATVGELAEWLAAPDDGSPETAERLAIALHHGHLPRLAASGLVDYDKDDRIVETRPRLASLALWLPTGPTRPTG